MTNSTGISELVSASSQAKVEEVKVECIKEPWRFADLQVTFPLEMPVTRSRGNGQWRLEEVWTFFINDKAFTVPIGFITDLYSVPWLLTLVIPRDERDNRPGLIHDFLYATVGLRATPAEEGLPREVCDRILLITSLQCAFKFRRSNSIYCGVRIGGWYQWEKLKTAGYCIARPMMN